MRKILLVLEKLYRLVLRIKTEQATLYLNGNIDNSTHPEFIHFEWGKVFSKIGTISSMRNRNSPMRLDLKLAIDD